MSPLKTLSYSAMKQPTDKMQKNCLNDCQRWALRASVYTTIKTSLAAKKLPKKLDLDICPHPSSPNLPY